MPAAGAWDRFGGGSTSHPSLLYEHCVVLQRPCLSWLQTRLAGTWLRVLQAGGASLPAFLGAPLMFLLGKG